MGIFSLSAGHEHVVSEKIKFITVYRMGMRLYDFKRGHRKTLEGIKEIMKELFGEVREEHGHLVSSYLGLERIEVWPEDKRIAIDTKSRKVESDEAQKTLRVWNEFLYRVTGYTAKERKKKMTKT